MAGVFPSVCRSFPCLSSQQFSSVALSKTIRRDKAPGESTILHYWLEKHGPLRLKKLSLYSTPLTSWEFFWISRRCFCFVACFIIIIVIIITCAQAAAHVFLPIGGLEWSCVNSPSVQRVTLSHQCQRPVTRPYDSLVFITDSHLVLLSISSISSLLKHVRLLKAALKTSS